MSEYSEEEILRVSDQLSRSKLYGAAQMISGLARERDEARALAENRLSKILVADEQIDKLRTALLPFARADRAIGDERGPFRFETGTGYRELFREDFRIASAALAELEGKAVPR